MLTVLCVTRNNPVALVETFQSWLSTTTDKGMTRFRAVIDIDDPVKDEYARACAAFSIELTVVPPEHIGWMNTALNYAALLVAGWGYDIGFVGDDHRFRTEGWDLRVREALQTRAFVYGNDGWQGANLPTEVFIRSDVIRALGYFALPGARHLYLDNQWKTLGIESDSMIYLDGVLIEHMHPSAGKGVWDDNHQRVNAPEMYGHDRQIFEKWLESGLYRDSDIVRTVMSR
jgi:hypothetical protein